MWRGPHNQKTNFYIPNVVGTTSHKFGGIRWNDRVMYNITLYASIEAAVTKYEHYHVDVLTFEQTCNFMTM